MKKILAVTLAIMMISIVIVAAFAEEEQPAEETIAEVTETVTAESPAEDPASAEDTADCEESAVTTGEESGEEATVSDESVERPSGEEPADAPAEESAADSSVTEETTAPADEELTAETTVEEKSETAADAVVTGEPAAEETPVQNEEVPVEETPSTDDNQTEENLVVEEPADDTEEEIKFTGVPGEFRLFSYTIEAGSTIYFHSEVKNANMEYRIRWERMNPHDPDKAWVTLEGGYGDTYKMEVTKECEKYVYRYTVIGADGTVRHSNEITFSVVVPEKTEEPATEEEQTEVQNKEPITKETEEAEEIETEVEEIITEESETEKTEETEKNEIEVEENLESVTEEIEAEEPKTDVAEEIETATIAEEKNDDIEISEDYGTAWGLPGLPAYEYELDEDGNLVLDEKGNPIVIRENLMEEDEIPVAFLRDEEGALILDKDGKPVVTQTVPQDATYVSTIEDALDPNRTIDIYYSWNNQQPALGGEVTFVAVLYGYDKLEYSIQWQQSSNNIDWIDISESNELRHAETITRENYKDFWRVQVIITGIYKARSDE